MFVFSLPSYSQFTIGNSYKPIAGDTLELKTVDTTGVVISPGGANQIWNYSDIHILPEIFYERFVQPSSTPYYSQFPNSNVATINTDTPTMYHYYNTTGSDWLLNGYAFTGFALTYSNPLCRMHYPISYGTQYPSTFTGIRYSGNTTYYYSGSRYFLGDGYGTLILPAGTYNNVLRVKILYEVFDTTKTGGVVVNTDHIFITEYNWYDEGFKFPILTIDEFSSNQISYLKMVYLGSRNPTVGIKKNSNKIPNKYSLFQNYPNPFNPKTSIRFDIKKSGYVEIKIFDIAGRLISVLVNEKINAGSYSVGWDASAYPSGVYFKRISVDGGKSFIDTKKMILIK